MLEQINYYEVRSLCSIVISQPKSLIGVILILLKVTGIYWYLLQ